MMRRTLFVRMTIHSPRAIPFALGPTDATNRALAKYQSRWMFGAQSEFLDLKAPQAEFVPFFLCNGRVRASFVGRAQYNNSYTDSKGKTSSHSSWVSTELLNVDTTFHENNTQLYGGYKYNNRHIHSALRHEANALKLQKISAVDVSIGSIGLFEISTSTMRVLLADVVKAQVRDLAEKQVRQFHQSAASIQIDFKEFELKVEDVYPTFVPCFVIKASYDAQEYTLYVSGSEGTVAGPYLVNALHVARVASLATFAMMMVDVAGAKTGISIFTRLLVPVAVYYIAFYGAKMFPAMRRDYYRRQRESDRVKHQSDDATGFKPSATSQRITEEYHRSTYWETHRYQQKQQQQTAAEGDVSGSARRPSVAKDSKGYYKLLGLTPSASVNDIRSAFRQRVIMHHPDAGGSTEHMATLNEAYRTLRDPKLRAAYDSQQ